MFLFKKMAAPFLLPPGLFILVLLGWGLWAVHRKNRLAAWLGLTTAALLWICAMGATADWMMGRLEAGLSIPEVREADVIIMLGGAAFDQSPDLSGSGAPGPGTMERMVTAARLQRRLGVPIIVSGGRVHPTRASIAGLAQRFLIDLGIPAQQVMVEDQSRDTYENALFSKRLCEQHGFQHPLLVTSGYHLKRAIFCFDRVGLPITPFPCALTTWPGSERHWYHLLPDADALAATAAALHEWLGLLYYRWVY